MKKILLSGLLLAMFLSGFAMAQDSGQPKTLVPSALFIELWNNAAFFDTNLENKNFSSSLARFEGKVGLNVGSAPLQVYGVYYGVGSQSNDYWDNSLFSGYGLRVMPLRDFPATNWANEWLPGVKLFAEKLSASYLKNAASAETLAKEDTRYGLEIWHEWNQEKPDRQKPWGELWSTVSYRETNFGWEEFKDYVVYFQPKIGIYLADGIAPYLRADVTYSGKSGASYSFLNVADYGVGVRFEPWRSRTSEVEFFHKFRMFTEVLGVTYLKDKPAAAISEVAHDVRFGIEFSYGR
ncbi:hypothetical protein COT42_07175 [Candidatus Saganbacteria bacterium CG08_land_8_20_14_0_20_45_16]|uniref:Uncharacterized protein n=1 Tax=Candidatus Saganbacteria bacterium CG08_land_8_20_14_0_20_45_16 TaxID=2014293 RepID=A0A2H0XX31_UNCSA|nr:MAG: hypothetical protein COT42_07175 [Candidatus Saganbacteria bacterium CG08_land_8_20_14_0_20_45_16]